MGRPGSAGLGGAAVKDVMMHQRPPSARTGGSARLMGPEQYTKAVGEQWMGCPLGGERRDMGGSSSNGVEAAVLHCCVVW